MDIQDKKVYDFASVGETTQVYKNKFSDPTEDFPVGIVTPLQLGYGNDGLFRMSKDVVTQVRDNFRNMLSTNWGERLMLYDFGANLAEMAFELGSEGSDLEAVTRIKRTIDKYMPFITPLTFESFSEPLEYPGGGLAKIGIRVSYSVEKLGPDKFIEEVIIYTAG